MRGRGIGISRNSTLFLVAVLFGIAAQPAVSTAVLAQTVVNCTGAGAENPATITSVVFDFQTQGCTVVDAGFPLLPQGSAGFQFNLAPATDIISGVVQPDPGNTNTSTALANMVSCIIPLGLTSGTSCQRASNTQASGALMLSHSVTGVLVVLTVNFVTSGVNNYDVTSASVTIAASPAGNGLTARDRSNITDALFNVLNQVDGGIFDTDGTSIFGTGGATGNGLSFTPTALSTGQASETGDPFYRMFGDMPPGTPEQGQSATSNASFDFRVDLNALQADARARAAAFTPGQPGEPLAFGDPATAGLDVSAYSHAPQSFDGWKSGMNGGPVIHQPRTNVWVSGKYVDFDDDQQNADRSGHIWRVTSGVSYRVDERTTLGAFGRVRKGEADSAALLSSLDSDFFGGGLFGVFRSHGGARLLLSGLYETSDNDIIIQGTTGSFDADQWTVEAIVDKRFTHGRHWIEPAVKVFYTEADRDGYVDSAGTQIAGSTLSLGRLSAGPTIGTTIAGDGNHVAELRPFAKVAGVWDFVNEGDFTLSTGQVFSTSDSGVTVGGGMEVEFVHGTILTVAGEWLETDSDLEAWSVKAGLGTSFAALGLGSLSPTGFVSFDLATTAEDQSANAKVTLPLK